MSVLSLVSTSLLGGGIGGVLRFVPEVFKFINSKSDHEHEFRMTKLQLDIDLARSKQAIDLVHVQGENADISAQQAIFLEGIKGASQQTGVKWVDALNATVRPFLTYWWMLIFTIYKGTVIYDAWFVALTATDFGNRIWNDNDAGTLAMITSFWFVDRVFRKHK